MGINAEAYRMGQAARRDNLYAQHHQALTAAKNGDRYAIAWLTGWDA